MISTQRQQKKNARHKAKIPGGGGKGHRDRDVQERTVERTPKGPPKIQDTPTLQNVDIVEVKNETNNVPELTTENKYAKRQVVSNENRYREIDDNEYQVETDDQLQARLVQLLNIPTVHTSTFSVFDNEFDSPSDHSVPYFAVDCKALAEKLQDIDMYKKLDIDTELRDLGDQEHDIGSVAPAIIPDTQRAEQKNLPLQLDLVLKKGKSTFQFQSPAVGKVPIEQSPKPKEASVHKPREERTHNATSNKPALYASSVSYSVEGPNSVTPYRSVSYSVVGPNSVTPYSSVSYNVAGPNSVTPWHSHHHTAELDNMLDGILAL